MLDLKRLDERTLAKALDFSILPKETTEAEIREGCAVTRQYGFAAFYTSSAYWSPIVREEFADLPDIEIGTGIAFPFGSASPSVKAFETDDAVRRGCTAVDLVMNIGAAKSGDWEAEHGWQVFRRTGSEWWPAGPVAEVDWMNQPPTLLSGDGSQYFLNLAMITALNRPHELKLHVRGAINNGLTKDEIKEVFLQAAIYCGVPAAIDSFRSAKEVFKEMGI